MSPPGRPKGEFRSAQHEGAPMSLPSKPIGAPIGAEPGLGAQVPVEIGQAVDVVHLGKTPRVTLVDHFAWQPPPLGKTVRKPPIAGKRRGR